jgi:hypothetical protein
MPKQGGYTVSELIDRQRLPQIHLGQFQQKDWSIQRRSWWICGILFGACTRTHEKHHLPKFASYTYRERNSSTILSRIVGSKVFIASIVIYILESIILETFNVMKNLQIDPISLSILLGSCK